MKKILVLVLVLVLSMSAVAFAAEAPYEADVPVSRIDLYRVDPDESSIGLKKATEVTVQKTVAKYAQDGWVIPGQGNSSDLLEVSKLSRVAVYGVEAVNTATWPEATKNASKQELVTWLVGQVTRLVYENGQVYACLNVEPYKQGTHVAQANLWVGQDEAEFWTVFRRPDGTWTLCTKTASKAQGGQEHDSRPNPPAPTPAPTAKPVDPGRDPEPETTTSPTPIPTAQPVDPGRDGDDNGDGGYENPLATAKDPGRDSVPAQENLPATEQRDDNGDGGYTNPLATAQDQGRESVPAQTGNANGNPLATPSDSGRD